MSDLGWQASLCLAGLAYIVLIVALSGRKKRRRNRLLVQLNSPHFRTINSAHYRVGSMNGIRQ